MIVVSESLKYRKSYSITANITQSRVDAYCVLCSHYPQLKGTTVASTPEQDRLRQLSVLNSMVTTCDFVDAVNLVVAVM